jgi:hypothetical protein
MRVSFLNSQFKKLDRASGAAKASRALRVSRSRRFQALDRVVGTRRRARPN